MTLHAMQSYIFSIAASDLPTQYPPRRLMFESYAEDVLSRHGIHIWDVWGLAAMGDYRMGDLFHASGKSTWAQNNDMLDLFACKA
jgi:hypothetical protein